MADLFTNSNPATVKDVGFGEYFNNPEFSDVKIVVGSREFFAHKIVLSAKSEVFKTMLSMIWSANSSEINLEETIQSEEVFEDFLAYLYSGDMVKLTEDNAIPLLMLADKYLVKDIASVIIEFMLKNISFENAVPWYRFTLQFKIDSLYSECITFLSHNFEYFVHSGQFDALDAKEFSLILDSGALVVKSEMSVVEALRRWLEACGRLMYDEVVTEFSDLFTYIRSPMLSAAEIDAVEHIPEFKDLLLKVLPCLYVGYKFHSLGVKGYESHRASFFYKSLTPRIYYQKCGVNILKDQLSSYSFQTPIELSQSHATKAIWQYSIGEPSSLRILNFPYIAHNPHVMVRVRTILFLKKPRDGVEETVILNDMDHTVMQGKNKLFFGQNALDKFIPDIRKYGLNIVVLPYPLDSLRRRT